MTGPLLLIEVHGYSELLLLCRRVIFILPSQVCLADFQHTQKGKTQHLSLKREVGLHLVVAVPCPFYIICSES